MGEHLPITIRKGGRVVGCSPGVEGGVHHRGGWDHQSHLQSLEGALQFPNCVSSIYQVAPPQNAMTLGKTSVIYFHFAREKLQARKVHVTYSRSQSKLVAELSCDPW